MVTQRQPGEGGNGAELLQPPLVYLLGFVSLMLASPLEELVGDAVARLVACVAFNGVLYAALRIPLPLAFRPFAVMCGASLGVLVALPSVLTEEFLVPGAGGPAAGAAPPRERKSVARLGAPRRSQLDAVGHRE